MTFYYFTDPRHITIFVGFRSVRPHLSASFEEAMDNTRIFKHQAREAVRWNIPTFHLQKINMEQSKFKFLEPRRNDLKKTFGENNTTGS